MHKLATGYRAGRQWSNCLRHDCTLANRIHQLVIHQDNRGSNPVSTTAPQGLIVLLVIRAEHQLDRRILKSNVYRPVNGVGSRRIRNNGATTAVK